PPKKKKKKKRTPNRSHLYTPVTLLPWKHSLAIIILGPNLCNRPPAMDPKGPAWPDSNASGSHKRPRPEDNKPPAHVSVHMPDFQLVAVEAIHANRPRHKPNGSHNRSESMPLTDRTNMSMPTQKPCPDHDKLTKELDVLKGKIDDIITTWQDRIADVEFEVNGMSTKEHNAIIKVLSEQMAQESQLCALIRSTVEAAVQSQLADITARIQNTALEVDKLQKNTRALTDSDENGDKMSPTGPMPNASQAAVISTARSYQHIAKLNANLSVRVQALEASATVTTQLAPAVLSAAKLTSARETQPPATEHDALTRRVDAQEALISQMKKQIRVMEAQINKKKEALADYTSTTQRLKELEAQMNTTMTEAKAETDRLVVLRRQTQAQVERFAAAMERIGVLEGRVEEQGAAGSLVQQHVNTLESYLPLRVAPPVQNPTEEMLEAARTLEFMRNGGWGG
ncbi:hypothetical protein B0T22DRAFT_516117, partial [Podospora appendiculata]